MTRTYAVLEVSRAAYDEIRAKLETAGYQHAFHEESHGADRDLKSEVIDMHGIALRAVTVIDPPTCKCGHAERDHRHPSSSRDRICLKPVCPCRQFVVEDRS